eukprot:scaffold7133_cov147-Isochrysis_galbana.AAC.1
MRERGGEGAARTLATLFLLFCVVLLTPPLFATPPAVVAGAAPSVGDGGTTRREHVGGPLLGGYPWSELRHLRRVGPRR